MRNHRGFELFIALSVLCAASSTLRAQLDTGTITISVHDASGAPVPRATATVRNHEPGIAVRTAETNDQGNFEFPAIPSARYTLRVEKTGFKAYEQTGIYLQVNEHLSVPVALEVGALSEQVN